MTSRHLHSLTQCKDLLLRLLAICLATAAFMTAGACSTVQGMPQAAPETVMDWPLGADGARIVWVRTIEDFRDAGSGKGLWGRALELITGGDESRSLVRPYGVLHDRSGRLYVADPGGGVVHCLDTVRNRYSVIGGDRTSPLRSPIGLAADPRGGVYITDSGTGMVYRHDPQDGSLRPFLVKRLQRPTGIAFNPANGLIYIADTMANQVVAVDRNGMETSRLGASGEGTTSFNHPTDLAVDRDGQILVTDSLNFRIVVLTPEGVVVNQFGAVGDAPGFFSRPKGIATDSRGNIYVSDALRDAVQVFKRDGSSLLVFGKAGSGRGRFQMPSGLYIDGNDYIYVSDTHNKRIQIFRFRPDSDVQGDEESMKIEEPPGAGTSQHASDTHRSKHGPL